MPPDVCGPAFCLDPLSWAGQCRLVHSAARLGSALLRPFTAVAHQLQFCLSRKLHSGRPAVQHHAKLHGHACVHSGQGKHLPTHYIPLQERAAEEACVVCHVSTDGCRVSCTACCNLESPCNSGSDPALCVCMQLHIWQHLRQA